MAEGGSPRASRAPTKGPTSSAPLSASAAATTTLAVGPVNGSTANSQPQAGSAPAAALLTPSASTGQPQQQQQLYASLATPHMAMRSSSRSSKEVHTGCSIEGNSAAAAAHKTGSDGEEPLTAPHTKRRQSQQHGVAAGLLAAVSDTSLDQQSHRKLNGLHASQNGLHASDADPSSGAEDDAPTPDPTAAGPSSHPRASRGLASPPFRTESLPEEGLTDGGGGQGGGDENNLHGTAEGGGGGGALRAKIPKLPMVRSGKKWYRARLMKEERGRVLLESSCKGSEGAQPFWLPKESDRIWHGSYKGRDWKYLVSQGRANKHVSEAFHLCLLPDTVSDRRNKAKDVACPAVV